MTTSHGINIGEPENLVDRELIEEFKEDIEEYRRFFKHLWDNAKAGDRNAYHIKVIIQKLIDLEKEIQKVEFL